MCVIIINKGDDFRMKLNETELTLIKDRLFEHYGDSYEDLILATVNQLQSLEWEDESGFRDQFYEDTDLYEDDDNNVLNRTVYGIASQALDGDDPQFPYLSRALWATCLTYRDYEKSFKCALTITFTGIDEHNIDANITKDMLKMFNQDELMITL